MIIEEEMYLEHFGVRGMKWGVRKAPDRITPNKSDTKVTKEVKRDYNDLDNKAFFKKYATTKGRYAKRVKKYGDPYQHRVDQMAKSAAKKSSTAGGKKQSRKERKAEQLKLDEKKVTEVLNTALGKKETLINLNGQIIMTGKEFTEYAMQGGAINAKRTSVYAIQNKKGQPYELQE